jgi:bifunctional UDP-N-acetylglucosamine pyrophosphorylase/glucosamine-1-phosphate N-acetyltransferase
MRSSRHKMLHKVAGLPLLERVLRAIEPLAPERTVVVVGHGAEEVERRFRGRGLTFALQEPQLGTGHALMVTRPLFEGFDGDILVVNGDAPLLQGSTLALLVAHHRECGAGMSMLTYQVADPTGLGRVVRSPGGEVVGVVEERDLEGDERALDEIVPGFYLFDRRVFALGERLNADNDQREYYITDLPAIYLAAGHRVEALVGDDDAQLRVGVNTRAELAEAEAIVQRRLRRRWLAAGVTMVAPDSVFLDETVELAEDVTLDPGVILRGRTRIGTGATVGAYSYLENADVEAGVTLAPHAVLRRAPVEEGFAEVATD